MQTPLLNAVIATIASIGGLAGTASASVVLSGWTFETNTPSDVTNSGTGPAVTSEVGIFTTGYTAQGIHADPASDWTTPAGNGSFNAYSVNTWTVGDYFQFASSTIGYEGISIAFDQTGSNTGPRDFTLSYSTNGTDFSVFGSPYSIINGSWSNAAPTLLTPTTFTFDLSSVTALDNQSTVYFRISQTNTTSISGATVATGGTGRVDNVYITAVPEPTVALLGSLGLFTILRRRR